VYQNDILATIKLAHFYKSAFTPQQVRRYMRRKVSQSDFEDQLAQLLSEGTIWQQNGALFSADLLKLYNQKKVWSRDLFMEHKKLLGWLTRMPWVRFVALTGANSFESCREKDDIDLFLITSPKRLWISYVLLVIFSKLLKRRHVFCLNYLIDETHLEIRKKDYYTAVQIMQMIPLTNNSLSNRILQSNRWILSILPNAASTLERHPFYHLGSRKLSKTSRFSLMTLLNRLIFSVYSKHLRRKYPMEFGKGIALSEGVAQLNRVDHHDSYVDIYREIEAAL